MNYVEFYHEISKKHELSQYACDKVFALITKAIIETVCEKGKCDIKGFGKFYITDKKYKTVKFKFDDAVTELINNHVSFRVRQDIPKKD